MFITESISPLFTFKQASFQRVFVLHCEKELDF